MKKIKVNLKKVSKLSQHKIEMATAHRELVRAAKVLKRRGLFSNIPSLTTSLDMKQISKAASAALITVSSQIKARTKKGAEILQSCLIPLQKLGFKIVTNKKDSVVLNKKVGRVEVIVSNDLQYLVIQMKTQVPIVDVINHKEVQEILQKSLPKLLGV